MTSSVADIDSINFSTPFPPADQAPNDQAEPLSQWRGRFLLGQGGDGAAVLWTQTNNTQRIVKNRVEKIAFRIWDSPSWWTDGVIGGVTKEASILEFLSKNTDGKIPLLYSHAPNPRYQTYRIWMEYCEYGLLEDLADAHWRQRVPIPEPFLWYVFEQLALACVELETSTRARAGARAENDEVVVHADIKSNNIFLTREHGTYFPLYPTVRLGDFGRAEITHPTDPNNPINLVGVYAQTPGWSPMELWTGNDYYATNPQAALPKPIGSAANVWQMARTMLCMMQGSFRPEQLNFFDDGDGGHAQDVDTRDDAAYTGAWSAALKDLLGDCLVWDPAARPTPTQLFARVRGEMATRTGAMQTRRYSRLRRHLWRTHRVLTPADKYAAGLRWSDVRSMRMV